MARKEYLGEEEEKDEKGGNRRRRAKKGEIGGEGKEEISGKEEKKGEKKRWRLGILRKSSTYANKEVP